MPANSSDVLVHIQDSLQAKLGGNKFSLEEKLASSSKRILLHKINFEPARQSMSFQDQLRAKYTPLNPSSQKIAQTALLHNGEHKDLPKENVDGLPNPRVVIYPPEKVRLEWPKQRLHCRVGPGLQNMGNTCFLNSVLQCLTHTPPLVSYFFNEDHETRCKVIGCCMMCELQRHVRRCYDSPSAQNNRIVKPLSFIQKIKMIAKHLHIGRQEDAHEFLRLLVETLAKSCLNGYGKELDRFSKETTVVNQIFGGFLRSQVICLKCKARSNTFDPFMDISLDIKNAHNIQRAFENFVKVEFLESDNAYNCAKCKQKVNAQKRFSVHKPSNVLTLQLKRFDMTRFHGKLTKHVAFPDKLDLRPYMSNKQGEPVIYNLYGVLVHHGSTTSSGHYFAYVKSATQNWFQMNDQMVRPASLHTVLDQEAYLLFYVKQRPIAIVPAPKAPVIAPKLSPSTAPTIQAKPKVNPGMGILSNELGTPINRKEIGPQAFPSQNGKPHRTTPSIIPSLSQRDKISFGIKPKPQQAANAEDGKPGNPRIVMHIKHGKIAYNSAAEKAAAMASKAEKEAANEAAKKIQKLVPYENNSDSDTEKDKKSNMDTTTNHNKEERASSQGTTHKVAPFEPVMDTKLNTTTTVPGSYGPLNKHDRDVKSEAFMKRERDLSPVKKMSTAGPTEMPRVGGLHSIPARRSISDPTGLSVNTSPDWKVKATTRGWNVLDSDAQVSPSIASESSSVTSMHSTTEWQVIEKEKKAGNLMAEAQHVGWKVTPTKAESPGGDNSPDSLQITLKKTPPRATSESPKVRNEDRLSNGVSGEHKARHVSHNGHNGELPVKKSAVALFGACLFQNGTSTPSEKSSGHSSDFSGKNGNRNGNDPKASASAPVLNGVSDSFSSEDSQHKKSKKHKKEKKHRKDKHRDREDDNSWKKKKKHKKHKHEDRERLLESDSESEGSSRKRKRSSGDDHSAKKHKPSEEDFEWVERTYENIAKKEEAIPEKPRKQVPVQSWDHHVQDSYKARSHQVPSGDQHSSGDRHTSWTKAEKPKAWDGTRFDNKNTVRELLKSKPQGFGGKVTSWDGGVSSVDQEVIKDRQAQKRSWEDDYEDELDSGRVKKVKSQPANYSSYSQGNQFQKVTDYRNTAETERKKGDFRSPQSSSRSSSVSSSGHSDRLPHSYSHHSNSQHGSNQHGFSHHSNNSHHRPAIKHSKSYHGPGYHDNRSHENRSNYNRH